MAHVRIAAIYQIFLKILCRTPRWTRALDRQQTPFLRSKQRTRPFGAASQEARSMANRSRRVAPVGLALVLTLVMAGCNANSQSPEPAKEKAKAAAALESVPQGQTLHYLSRRANESFETANAQMVPTSRLRWVHRGLTSWQTFPDKDTILVPDLATDTGTTADGGKTWTFTLKEGLKFSDGSPITAQDVKYGIERSFAPMFQGGLGYHKTLLVGGTDYDGPYDGKKLDSIEVVDDHKIVFHLKRPFGNWPWIVSMPAFAPVPAAADTKPETYGEHPVASGPYQVTSFRKGSQAVLERNPNWKADTDQARFAGPDKIVLDMGLNNDTIVQRLIDDKGEDKAAISNALISPSQFQRIESDPSISNRMANSPSGYFRYLAMNVKRPGLSDVRVRRAINYAVNKAELQSVYGGPKFGGQITSTIMTPGIPGHTEYDLYDGGDTGNVDKAKELLAEAGVSELKLTLTYPTDVSAIEEKEAQSIKNSLARIGVKVELKGLDGDTWSELVSSDDGDYDMTTNGWGADFPSGMSTIQPLFASSEIGNGGGNASKYSNPKVDAAIDAAIAEPDLGKAATMWAAIDKQIMEDAPVVPILVQRTQALAGSKIMNYFIPAYPPFANELVVGVGR
ncbi:ABC transporter substrate-binding protein [Streptosporangium saharense]|uniref:Peptide/nickel transport system substrate-binding protein n=1 Tax=Streptosporangium saharense TaxID=1706840 RepID=A0A7W7QQ03_9ACTN|nr:ABC transporter substrate-binding protein [Streptosporangium saharense]MBB4917464.1 peptide/nickel transport system substrate-binding protein [Streptosporangium saharense]